MIRFPILTSLLIGLALHTSIRAQAVRALPADVAIIELDLPDGAAVTAGGRDYGEVRRLRYDKLKAGVVYQEKLVVRTVDGANIERAVQFSAGKTVQASFLDTIGRKSIGPPPARQPGALSAVRRGQSWAILIGINAYTEIDKLRFCSNDMQLLREQLIGAGFPKDHVILLNDDATDRKLLPIKANIERQLELVLGLAEADDLVVVAFSGHGMFVGGTSYLCPTEAHVDDSQGTMVSVDSLYGRMKNCRAALKLLLIDACRNDPLPAGRKSATAKEDTRQLAATFERPPEGTLVLASCAPGQVSWEDEKLGHGVFMSYLLRGLRGEADTSRNGRVSLGELYEFSSLATKKHVADRWSDFQTPQLFGQIDGVFEFEPAVSIPEDRSFRFTGTWTGTDGQIFYFDLTLTAKGSVARGKFLWTLASAPAGTQLAQLIGRSGTETVEGTYNEGNRRFDLRGLRVSDSTLLVVDQYRLLVSPDGMTINGSTRGNSGRWASILRGTLAK